MSTQIFLNGITIEQFAEVLCPLILKSIIFKEPQFELELLTREEACDFLSMNKTTLWKHTKSGKLKSYGIGNRVYYKKSELLDSVKPLNK